jgi:hypothetical protein
MIFVLVFLYLLLMMISKLLERLWIQMMVNSGRRPWLKKWNYMMLVVEPDYLPDFIGLCFQSCLYPMKIVHPRILYTPPRGGVAGGLAPLWGLGESEPWWGFGGEAPKGKIAL